MNMKKNKAIMKQYWDIIEMDLLMIASLVYKGVIMFIDITLMGRMVLFSSILLFCLAIIAYSIFVAWGYGKMVIKDVSFLMQNIWSVVKLLSFVLLLINIKERSFIIDLWIYFSTLAIFILQLSLQIYFYVNDKFRVRRE